MGPALAAKFGSRGKTQHRCCQGRIASSLSQRQMVVSLIEATSPARRTCSASSAVLQRDSGTPKVAGSSQAMALTSTSSSGGKDPGTPRTWPLFQAWESLVEEPLSPQAHHFASSAQTLCDFIVGKTLCRQ